MIWYYDNEYGYEYTYDTDRITNIILTPYNNDT
jgi:hypothetical protein